MGDLSHAIGTVVYPVDYFDMFDGTSTSGLIAIMLEFGELDVFVTAVDAENASGDSIVLRSYDVGSEMKQLHTPNRRCRPSNNATSAIFPTQTTGEQEGCH
ncbi:hypothetical protein ACEPAG_8137 [Sanghuangporus baumii]